MEEKFTNRINWNIVPAFKMLVLVLIILLPSVYLELSFNTLLFFSISSISIAVVLLINRYRIFAYLCLSLSLGGLLSLFNLYDSACEKQTNFTADDIIFQGEIVKIVKKNINYKRLIVKGEFLSKYAKKSNYKILLTIMNKDSLLFSKLIPGIKIYTENYAHFPQKPTIIDEFNEERYLKSINCQLSGITNTNKTAILNKPQGFYYWSYSLQEKVRFIINQNFSNDIVPIVSALILGDKSEIPPKIKQHFSYTGTAHLLAISGLHIGFIAAGLFLLLGFIRNEYIKFVFFSIGLLVFIILSGLSPSAVRAGSMFILYLFLRLIGRKPSALNIASFVVLMYLVLFPEIILNISYQLSSLAILSIVLFYKPINEFFYNKLRMTKYISSSISLSIATSISLAPLVALYFNIFPALSPLANIIIVPAMSLGLFYIIVSLAFSFIPIIAHLFALTAELFLNLIITINELIVDVNIGIFWSREAMFFAFVSSILILYFIYTKNIKQLVFRIIIAVLIGSLSFNIFDKRVEQKYIHHKRLNANIFEFPKHANNKLFIIIDDKPDEYPHRDISFEKYLISIEDTVNIIYTGNFGINMIDNIEASTIKRIKIVDWTNTNIKLSQFTKKNKLF